MTQGDASARFAVLLEAGQTTTPGCVLFRLAVSVGSARQGLARIDATALDAGQLSVAIVVFGAFRSRFTSASILERNQKKKNVRHVTKLLPNWSREKKKTIFDSAWLNW